MRFPTLAALCFLLLGGPGSLQAQQWVHRSAAVWPELQLDYVLPSGSMWYFRNHYRHVLDQDFNYLRPTGPLQWLERVQFRLGFDHQFNRHWRAGISESYALERKRNILFNEVFTRYSRPVGAFQMAQRMALEYLVRWPKNNNSRLRLRTELDRTFPLGRLLLRPRVSYELFYVFAFQNQPAASPATRWVDRSRLRLENQLVINRHLALTPYFMWQTDYFFVEPAFDANNQVLRAGGKQNHLTPVWGLDLRFTVYKAGAATGSSGPKELNGKLAK